MCVCERERERESACVCGCVCVWVCVVVARVCLKGVSMNMFVSSNLFVSSRHFVFLLVFMRAYVHNTSVHMRVYTSVLACTKKRRVGVAGCMRIVKDDLKSRMTYLRSVSICQHMLAYVSIRQHTSACVTIRQHAGSCMSIVSFLSKMSKLFLLACHS